jgi:hypothetical protein
MSWLKAASWCDDNILYIPGVKAAGSERVPGSRTLNHSFSNHDRDWVRGFCKGATGAPAASDEVKVVVVISGSVLLASGGKKEKMFF